jgi:hypothetical protein
MKTRALAIARVIHVTPSYHHARHTVLDKCGHVNPVRRESQVHRAFARPRLIPVSRKSQQSGVEPFCVPTVALQRGWEWRCVADRCVVAVVRIPRVVCVCEHEIACEY